MNSLLQTLSYFVSSEGYLITIRYSIILLLTLGALSLLWGCSSHLRARVASLSLISLFLVTILMTLLPSWDIAILPSESSASSAGPKSMLQEDRVIQNSGGVFAQASTRPVEAVVVEHSFSFVIFAWGLGVLFMFAYWCLGQISMRRILRRSASMNAERLQARLDFLKEQYDVRSKIHLRLSKDSRLPACAGFLKPHILLPTESVEWGDDQIDMVLLHEIAHVKHGDLLIQPFVRFALALQWFNPFAWLTYRAYLLEREQACDDFVLRSGMKPSEYGACLVDFLKNNSRSIVTSPAYVAMASHGTIEGRLRSILSKKKDRNTSKFLTNLSVFSCGFSVIGLVSIASLTSIPVVSLADVGESRSDTQIMLTSYFIDIPPESESFSRSVEPLFADSDNVFVGMSASEADELMASVSKSGAKLISMPTIVTLDGNPGVMTVGERSEYPKFRLDESSSLLVSDEYHIDTEGVSLELNPTMISEDRISIESSVTFTQLRGVAKLTEADLKEGIRLSRELASQSNPSFEIPVISKRSDEIRAELISGNYIFIRSPLKEFRTNRDEFEFFDYDPDLAYPLDSMEDPTDLEDYFILVRVQRLSASELDGLYE